MKSNLLLALLSLVALGLSLIYQYRSYHPIYAGDLGRQMTLGQYYGLTSLFLALTLKFHFGPWWWVASTLLFYIILRFLLASLWENAIKQLRPLSPQEIQEIERLSRQSKLPK